MLVLNLIPDTFDIKVGGGVFTFEQPTDREFVGWIQQVPGVAFKFSKIEGEKKQKEFFEKNKDVLESWLTRQFSIKSESAFRALKSWSGVLQSVEGGDPVEFSGGKEELWRSLPFELKKELVEGYHSQLLGVEAAKKSSGGTATNNGAPSSERSSESPS